MTNSELAKIIEEARCNVIGWEDAGNDGHRLVLAALIKAFDNTESALLCEPSLARKTRRPPDIVLIDPEIGVHVFEVKGIALDQIEGLEAGGRLRIRYATNVRNASPIVQVRNAMFDIKDATVVLAFGGDIRLPFNEKDQILGQKDRLTLSTVASAKGYDAYCVLLASANEFPTDVKGRATFYVGCTRAMEYLEVFAYQRQGLAMELELALTKINS